MTQLIHSNMIQLRNMTTLTSVLVFVVAISLLLPSTLSEELGTYRTQCDKDSDCNPRQFLECNKRTYVCSCPKSTIWDNTENSCRTMESLPCNIHHQFINSREKCVSSTLCIAGRCQCTDGLLRNGFGSCALSYGMQCNDNDNEVERNCALRFLLRCSKSEFVCKCMGEGVDHVWDEVRQRCVSLQGSSCDMGINEFGSRSDDGLGCITNAKCVNGYCDCLPGYSSTPDRQCLLDYGEKCDNNEGKVCNRYKLLNCGEDGKCGCEFYGQMAYDTRTQECGMLAGEFCDLPVQINKSLSDMDNGYTNNYNKVHRCVRDAECLPHNHNHNGKGKCSCVPGKFRSANGTCTNLKGHGLSCSYAGDCYQSEFLTCVISEDDGGICDCIPNEMFYDKDTSSCLVLPGRSCASNVRCGRNSNCDNGEYCICNDGFYLDPIKFLCYQVKVKSKSVTDTTIITSNTEDHTGNITEIGSSVPNIGINSQVNRNIPILEKDEDSISKCSKIPQDSFEFVKCNCTFHQESHVWSEDKRICLGLVGSVCEFDGNCVDNAYCDETCQCEKDARTTLNKTCSLKRPHIKHHHHQQQTFDKNEATKINPILPGIVSSGGRKCCLKIASFVFNLVLHCILVLITLH